MSEAAPQSTYEKVSTSLILMAVMLVGWGPFVRWAIYDPSVLPPYLMLATILIILALGAVFDATEHLLARGRGVYAAAVFCSIPAIGMVMTDASLLPVPGLMLLTSSGIWMAIRAKGDDRPYFLAMLGALFLVGGALFPYFVGSLSLAFVLWLILENEKRLSVKAVIVFGSLLAYVIGTAARVNLSLGIPTLAEISMSPGASRLEAMFTMLPWMLWILPVIIRLGFGRTVLRTWHIGAMITLLLLLAVGLWTHSSLVMIAAASSPILAILCADLADDYFRVVRNSFEQRQYLVPIILAAIGLGGFALFIVSRTEPEYGFPFLQVGIAAALICVLTYSALRHLPRATFAILFGSGVLFGSLLFSRHEFFAEPGENIPSDALQASIPYLFLAALIAILGFAVFRALYGPPIPKEAKAVPKGSPADKNFLYGEKGLRLFSDGGRAEWGGVPAEMLPPAEHFQFVVFGDIAGGEFPLSSRRGGYFVYREVCREIAARTPQFAISLGDLAPLASPHAYRRLRTMLRHIPVPLAATPGNHDVFFETEWSLAYFHALFGSDHLNFQIGPVQFILLNNAIGSVESEQLSWLDKVLASQSGKFKLVFCHQPIFDFRTDVYYGMRNREDAMRLHEIFARHNVSAVFSGHIHGLMSDMRDGVTYIISGGAGSKLIGEDSAHHFLTVEVTTDTLRVQALPLGQRQKRGMGVAEQRPLLDLLLNPTPTHRENSPVLH